MSTETLAANCCMVRCVDTVPTTGHLRLETRFLYPCGHSIDLFVENGSNVLTDFGQTVMLMADVQPMELNPRNIEDVLASLKVQRIDGALTTEFESSRDGLEDAVIRLGHACVRIATLLFAARLPPTR